MFADMLSPSDRLRMLDGVREQLWAEMKALGRTHERILARGARTSPQSYQPAMFLTLRRIKLVSAEIEFLDKLRIEFEHMPPGPLTVTGRHLGNPSTRVRSIDDVPKSRNDKKS